MGAAHQGALPTLQSDMARAVGHCDHISCGPLSNYGLFKRHSFRA
uniref:Uncharacterized protein n=1 Tax=Anguilla anguilla TaxID=7936 RepID=A0A0E9PD08_ANGAN